MAMPAGSNSEINITPMIDVLLVLLVIFMVIQPISPKGLDTAVPQSASSADQSKPEPTVVLGIAGSGDSPSYRINGQVFARDTVEPELEKAFAARADKVMFVRGDPGLDFASVAEAIGMGQRANARVGLLTPSDGVGR